jgi:mono/diheme cytochrome c family protein
MARKLLIVFAVLLGLLLLAIGGVLTQFYVLHPKVAAAKALTAPNDPATIERGRYLAEHVTVCVGCHSPVLVDVPGEPLVAAKRFAGRDWNMPDPYGAGVPRGPNLTSDPVHGIGAWTDGELVRAILEGVDRTGAPLFPMMPYAVYREHLTQDDALAIVAYLRTIPAIAESVPRSDIAFPVSMFVRTMPRPVETPAPAWPDDSLGRGQRLLALASCGDCHHTVDGTRQPIPGKLFAGGTKLPMPGGTIIHAPNITAHEATGVGAWTDVELERAIFEGKGRDGRDLYIMPWTYYRGMDAADRAALIQAVRAIPAVDHKVERFAAAP